MHLLDDVTRRLVALALQEDLGPSGDVTSRAIFGAEELAEARFVSREPLVVSGLEVAAAVFSAIDPAVRFTPRCSDGDQVPSQTPLAEVSGPSRSLWTGERTALNFLQRLCGIASLTRQYAVALQGSRCRLLDTRKTSPGQRSLEKAAVRAGGGQNHRFGLFDGILIKDNHVAAAGGVGAAVARVTQAGRGLLRVELEVDTLEQFGEALELPVEVVLLDNMSLGQLRRAVELRDQRRPGLFLEASGGVRLETVRAIADTGVDYVSAGLLTHGARAMDIGLDAV